MSEFHRSALLISGSKIGNAVLSFLGVAVFTKQLGLTVVGYFFLFQSMVQLLSFLSDGSLRTAVEKRISEGLRRREVIGTALSIKLVALPVVSVLLWFARDIINSYVGVPVTLPLIVGLVLTDIGNLFIRIIAGDLEIGDTAVIRLSRNAVWFVGGGALALSGYETLGLIYSYVAGTGVMTLWALFRCDLTIGRPSKTMFMSLASYARYDILAGASRRIHNWADVLIIGLFLTPAAVTIYEAAWRVTQLSGLVSVSMAQVIFPDVSDAVQNDNLGRIKSNIRTSILWSSIFVFPALFGGLLLGESILSLLFGIETPDGVVVLGILLLGQTVFVNYSPFKRVLDGLGKVNLSARSAIVMTTTNVTLNVILVYEFGIIGAAIATSTSMVAGLAVVTYYLRQYIEFPYPTQEIAFFIAASSVMAGAVVAAEQVVETTTVIGLTVTVCLGALVYFSSLVGFPDTRSFLVRQYRNLTG